MRAAYRIIAFYHHCKVVKFVRVLSAACKEVVEKKDFMKAIAWPKPSVGMEEFLGYVQKIHRRWQAYMVLKRYTPQQQEQLRYKSIAAELLGGRRQDWGLNYEWVGNYLAKGPTKDKFGRALTPLMEKHGCKRVLFSSMVMKLNTKGKLDERAIVVTEQHIYRLDPKSFKIRKNPIPLSSVTGFAVSHGEDQAVVIKFAATDLVLTLKGDASSAELVSLVTQALGKNLPVTVDSKLQVNVKGQARSLSFSMSEEKTTFKRRPSGFALVTRKASVIVRWKRRNGLSREMI